MFKLWEQQFGALNNMNDKQLCLEFQKEVISRASQTVDFQDLERVQHIVAEVLSENDIFSNCFQLCELSRSEQWHHSIVLKLKTSRKRPHLSQTDDI